MLHNRKDGTAVASHYNRRPCPTVYMYTESTYLALVTLLWLVRQLFICGRYM